MTRTRPEDGPQAFSCAEAAGGTSATGRAFARPQGDDRLLNAFHVGRGAKLAEDSQRLAESS
jgi:hypothetical protein